MLTHININFNVIMFDTHTHIHRGKSHSIQIRWTIKRAETARRDRYKSKVMCGNNRPHIHSYKHFELSISNVFARIRTHENQRKTLYVQIDTPKKNTATTTTTCKKNNERKKNEKRGKKTKNHYSLKTNLPPKKATVKLIRRMFG